MLLNVETKATFLNLASQLSPENLHADGERSPAQAKKLQAQILKTWKGLEKDIGYEISEEEAYGFADEVRRHDLAKRQKEIDAQPSHGLLEKANPGVWTRKGGNNLNAYYIWGPAKTGTGYELFSEFGYVFHRKEKLGTFETLAAAVDHAEAFLKTITFDTYKAARPLYRDENIHRELGRLPVV